MFDTLTQFDYRIIYYTIISAGLLLSPFLCKCNTRFADIIMYICVICISLFIGHRPMDVGADTGIYEYYIQTVIENDYKREFQFGEDPVFFLLLSLLTEYGGVTLCLTIISLITNFVTYLFCKKLGKLINSSFAPLIFFAIISSFSYFSQQINVIRIGLAMSFALLSTIYLIRKNLLYTVLTCALAVFIHFSSIFLILPAIIVRFTGIKLKYYNISFFSTIAVAVVGVSFLSLGLFSFFNLTQIESYTANIDDLEYTVGFRPTFVLFNTFFLCCFMALKKYSSEITNYYYRIFIITSIIFFLWFAIPFSDRIGAFSWNIIPVLGMLLLSNKYSKNPFKIVPYVFVYAGICFMI